MSLLKLRDYQDETIKALHTRWDKGLQCLAVVLPTGAGKTVIFSHLSDQALAETVMAGKKVLILAHRGELLEQAKKKLKSIAPHLKVGIFKAARRETTGRNVIIASEPSLRNPKSRELIKNVGMIIVDECHHVTDKNKYGEILEHFGAFDLESGVRVVGFTATLVRADKAHLGAIWQEVAYQRDITFMIRKGHLIKPRGKRIEVDDLDLSGVKRTGGRNGDYQDAALGEALAASLAPRAVADAYREHAAGRTGLLFAPTVESAHVFADALNDAGIKTEVVTGETKQVTREAIFERLRTGITRVVANCMVLTEGFDEPTVSCVVVARPTKNVGLYQQIVGRGLRIDPEVPYAEQDCLILDVVGASQDKTLASLADLSKKKIVLKDMQDLIEAEDEAIAEEKIEKPELEEAELVDFDPLASASRWIWLRTRKSNTHYIQAGTGPNSLYVFLVEVDRAKYDLMWCTTSAYASFQGMRGGMTEHQGVSLDVGMAWADQMADDHCTATGDMGLLGAVDYGFGRKRARSRLEPTDAQKIKLSELGIALEPGATRAEVSDLISSGMATKRIEPIVNAYKNDYLKNRSAA